MLIAWGEAAGRGRHSSHRRWSVPAPDSLVAPQPPTATRPLVEHFKEGLAAFFAKRPAEFESE